MSKKSFSDRLGALGDEAWAIQKENPSVSLDVRNRLKVLSTKLHELRMEAAAAEAKKA